MTRNQRIAWIITRRTLMTLTSPLWLPAALVLWLICAIAVETIEGIENVKRLADKENRKSLADKDEP
jgi:hypothetical protein